MQNIFKYVENHKGIFIGIILMVVLGFGYFDRVKSDSEGKTSQVTQTNKSITKKKNSYIYVDVQGSVNKPGFYSLKKDSRLFDLLGLAGGLKAEADLKSVNQAEKLHDQQQIYISSKEESAQESSNSAPGRQSDSKEDVVNINVATVEDFQKLSGIGPKKAEKIVDFRNENGSFSSIKDLTKVSGIGDKTLEALENKITV